MRIVGYTDSLCAAPGDTVAFRVSCVHPSYRAELVRLIHGDDNPDGPGVKTELLPSSLDGEYPGRVQALQPGSYARVPPLSLGDDVEIDVWVCPTTPGLGEQTILAHGRLALVLDSAGAPGLRVGRARSRRPECPCGPGSGTASLPRSTPVPFGSATCLCGRSCSTATPTSSARPPAGWSRPKPPSRSARGSTEAVRATTSTDGSRNHASPRAAVVVAHWDFSLGIGTRRISDVSGTVMTASS